MSDSPKFSLALIQAEKRSRFNPLSDLEPDALSRYLQEFRAGHLANLARVMDAIEETDDVLVAVCGKAKSSVARHGWEVLTVDTQDDAQAALAQKQKESLEFFYNNLRSTSALDQDEHGGVSLLVRQMMDAKGKRYSVHNIVWAPKPGGLYAATFHHVPLWFFENTEGRMRFISQPFGYYGESMEPGAWLVTKGVGLHVACAVAWMFKHLPLRDWLIYCSRHGMPGIEGVTDAPEGSTEWNLVKTAVEAAATEFSWVRNRSSEINTIEFGAKGEMPQPPLVERMDRAMSAIWRGADLSTISSGTGEGRGASLQGEEKDIVEQDDAAWISETLNLKVDRLVLDFVFGPDVPALAYVKIIGANQQKIDQDLKIDAFAIQHGHPVSKKQFSERYNRPLPAPEDELLTAAQSTDLISPAGPIGPTSSNERAAAETALQKLGLSRANDLQPLRTRLERILKIKNADILRDRLLAFVDDLPQLLRDINSDPEQARIWEDELRTALASGLTTKPTEPVLS